MVKFTLVKEKRSDWVDDGYYPVDRRDNRAIFWVMVVCMLLNFAATAVKMVAGVLTGALSVVADSLDSLFDGLSHITGFAGLYAASKPPDASYPYGQRKFETVAALSIAVLLFITTWQILQAAWRRLQDPQPPQVNLWVVLAMVVAMLIQAGTAMYEYRMGRRLRSEWLVADSYHTRASILVTLSVLGGLGLVKLGFPAADPVLAGVVALFIAKIGVDILKETLPVLVDKAPLDPRRIAEVARQVPGVKSYHRVRSRGSADSAAVDLHVRVAPEMTVEQANAIGDDLRQRLLALEGINDVTIHLEPQHEEARNAGEIYAILQHAASHYGLRVHEAWTERSEGSLRLETHLGVSPSLTLGQAHALVHRLEDELHHRLPELSEVHTHIEMAADQVRVVQSVPAEVEQAVKLEIQWLLAELPGVGEPHNIEMHDDPDQPGGIHVALECILEEDRSIGEAHQLSSIIENELCRRVPDVTDVFVHLEPPGAVD